MMWLEMLVAKLDKRIDRLEVWWDRATPDQKTAVGFGIVFTIAVIAAVL